MSDVREAFVKWYKTQPPTKYLITMEVKNCFEAGWEAQQKRIDELESEVKMLTVDVNADVFRES